MEYNEYGQQNENGFRKRFLIGMLIVLGVIVIGAAAVLISFGVRDNKYNAMIKSANEYFTAGDYQNAIASYELAIEINGKKESAYLNMASAYVALENYEAATSTIQKGLLAVESIKLQEKQVEIQNLIFEKKALEEAAEEQAKSLTLEAIENYSQAVTLENNTFDMVANYTYTEYIRDFGNVSASQSGGSVVLNYANNGFKATYYNLDKEKVVDAATGLPYAICKPLQVSFESLRKVFSTSSEVFTVSYNKLKELFGTKLEFHQDSQSGMYYISAEYKGCKLSVETDKNGNIVKETAWNQMEPLYRTRFEGEDEKEGEVKGYVQDAMTGKGMRATMKIRERDKKTGTPIETINVSGDGSYSFAGDAGIYTVEISAKGYITEYFNFEVFKNQIKTGTNFVLAPEVAEGEIRIVLTWGSSPADLDSYAIGEDSSGRDFFIGYKAKKASGVGNLDVDDTSGFGPETITITDVGASFMYSVVKFSGSGSLSSSGATVKVYVPGEKAPIVYKVPAGSGVRWDVFEYENGEIKKINDINDNVHNGEAKR